MPDQLTRYGYIDAVRGYAILMVMAVHTAQAFNELPAPLSTIIAQGARGVQLFFVASALALCFSWTARKESAGSFYARRLFRIAPMFWLAIVFFVWLEGTGPRLFAPEGIGSRHIAMTAMFLHGFWPDTITSVVPGGWSVANEVIFYALFPFLAPALLKSSWRTVLIVAAVAIIGGAQLSRLMDGLSYLLPKSAADVSGVYFSLWFPRQLPCFIFGIMLFKWSAERSLPTPAIAAPLCIFAIGLMAAVPFLEGVKYALPLGLQTTYGLVFALFVFSLMSWKSSPLVNAPAIWIGKVSYSAYFVHFGVLHYLAVPRFSGNAVLDFAAAYTATVLITVALASLTYWFIEQPMIKLGSSLISQRGLSRSDGAGLITRPAAETESVSVRARR
jgi:exopolysaccharide production protein ExoZ